MIIGPKHVYVFEWPCGAEGACPLFTLFLCQQDPLYLHSTVTISYKKWVHHKKRHIEIVSVFVFIALELKEQWWDGLMLIHVNDKHWSSAGFCTWSSTFQFIHVASYNKEISRTTYFHLRSIAHILSILSQNEALVPPCLVVEILQKMSAIKPLSCATSFQFII